MFHDHYVALFTAYGAAVLAWLVLRPAFPALWPAVSAPSFPAPWREVAWALLAVATAVGVGLVYSHRWLLPATSRDHPALDVVNQVIIYSPFLLLLVLRRQGLDTAWLPTRGILPRAGVGLGLALVALLLYSVVRAGGRSWVQLVPRVYDPRNVSFLAQVLLEDLSIAVLFVRLRAALGLGRTLWLVAGLFAAAHIPSMLAGGATAAALLPLVADTVLGVCVLAVVQRSADIWWFWMVHFGLDMTQFHAVPT